MRTEPLLIIGLLLAGCEGLIQSGVLGVGNTAATVTAAAVAFLAAVYARARVYAQDSVEVEAEDLSQVAVDEDRFVHAGEL